MGASRGRHSPCWVCLSVGRRRGRTVAGLSPAGSAAGTTSWFLGGANDTVIIVTTSHFLLEATPPTLSCCCSYMMLTVPSCCYTRLTATTCCYPLLLPVPTPTKLTGSVPVQLESGLVAVGRRRRRRSPSSCLLEGLTYMALSGKPGSPGMGKLVMPSVYISFSPWFLELHCGDTAHSLSLSL